MIGNILKATGNNIFIGKKVNVKKHKEPRHYGNYEENDVFLKKRLP